MGGCGVDGSCGSVTTSARRIAVVMRGLESTSLYFRGVAARPGGRIDPLIRRSHGGARGLPALRDSGRGASDRWRAVTVCEPAHAMLKCAVERRVFLVGANPTQRLSLPLVAARAIHGGNDMG